MSAAIKDSLTAPSLAELRAMLATVEPVFSAADRARRGTELEILAHVPALIDVACAARALDDCDGGLQNVVHREWLGTAYALKDALKGVRP